MIWPFKKKPARDEVRSAYFTSEAPLVSYWTYFRDERTARDAAECLRAQELLADVQHAAGKDGSWLLLAYMPLPGTEDVVERYSQVVKSVVGPLGGEYDGWEAGPLPDQETAEQIQRWLDSGVGAASS